MTPGYRQKRLTEVWGARIIAPIPSLADFETLQSLGYCNPGMNTIPAGIVTFLFTDIQGSTRLWQEHSDAMPAALQHHRALLTDAIASHTGYVFQIVGDAFCAAFSTAADGLEAALAAQYALAAEPWGETGPLRVRMALHTGPADVQPGDFTSGEYISGLTLSRAARLLATGHGGQILLSQACAELVRHDLPRDVALRDLGPRRLKDLIRPEQIFQVVAPGLPSDFAPLKTLDVHPHNLPVPLTSFIGREHEMVQIRSLLAHTHLLTLTGIGGTGKTRLALQAAANLVDEYPDGIWLVELAPLADPALVPQAVVTALDVPAHSNRSLVESLVDHLRDKHLLLLLDNCEQVVEGCTELTARLLRAGPQLRILATSRTPLGTAGETLFPVLPLALPEPGQMVAPSALSRYEAVRLFVERARVQQPAFELTAANAPAVAQICQRLDGIPLAIEFAAARIRLLTPGEIAARLDDRFTLLTGGSRTILPRHQTLRAALDWSYDLLSKTEQVLFSRLAVFAGSFSLEDVMAVCADAGEGSAPVIRREAVLDLLAALIDHSLVGLEELGSETRYILLETVRQYGLERLQAAGAWETLQDRHLAWFVALAREGEPHVFTGRPIWIDRFEAEFDNFRAAMAVALARSLESAVLLAKALDEFTQFSPRRYESHGWAMRILADTSKLPPGLMRASALFVAGDLSWSTGDNWRACKLMEAGLDMAHQLGNTRPLLQLSCLLMYRLAVVHGTRGDLEQMKRYADQLMPIARQIDDQCFIAWGFWLPGHWALRTGRLEVARVNLEQSLAIARREDLPQNVAASLYTLTGLEHLERNLVRARQFAAEWLQVVRAIKIQWGILTALSFLGRILVEEGDTIEARAHLEEGLVIARDLKLRGEQVACLAGLAAVAGKTGNEELAARLYGAIETEFALPHHWTMSDLSHRVYDPIFAAARERLGAPDFDAAAADGRLLTLDQAIDLALQREHIE